MVDLTFPRPAECHPDRCVDYSDAVHLVTPDPGEVFIVECDDCGTVVTVHPPQERAVAVTSATTHARSHTPLVVAEPPAPPTRHEFVTPPREAAMSSHESVMPSRVPPPGNATEQQAEAIDRLAMVPSAHYSPLSPQEKTALAHMRGWSHSPVLCPLCGRS